MLVKEDVVKSECSSRLIRVEVRGNCEECQIWDALWKWSHTSNLEICHLNALEV